MSNQDFTPESEKLRLLQEQAHREGRTCVIGGLIRDADGRIFVQKRASDRHMFPGCWDIAGGHVEPGESLYQALAREILEETGWHLERIVDIVAIFDWEAQDAQGKVIKRELDFLVEVTGDLANPQLETSKFTEFRWVGRPDLPLLLDNRSEDDRVIYNLVKTALEMQAWENG